MTHMKAIRNVIIILLLFIIFVFVFAGEGTFDKYLPLSEIKGAMITGVTGSVYDLQDGDYMIREKDKARFRDMMLKNGWQMQELGDGRYQFERDGQSVTYQEKGFLGFFTLYQLIP